MQQQKELRVSVVIPCFNEESTLKQCLDALMRQTKKPLEIIVVDNNSTDRTADIAKSHPLVRIIKERKQGLVFARSKGFDSVKGDIIARIDADSRPAPDWVSNLQKIFSNPKVQAATGTGNYYDAPFNGLSRPYRNLLFVRLNRLMIGHHMLWGSNMALRSQAWQKIKKDVCRRLNIMEDLDLSAHINQAYGHEAIRYNPALWADISIRRGLVSFKSGWRYLKMWPRTMRLHNYQRRFIVWPALIVLLVSMVLGGKMLRFYSQKQKKFIFSRQQWRRNPEFDRGNP